MAIPGGLLWTAGAAAAAGAAATTVAIRATPSVGDAPERVRRLASGPLLQRLPNRLRVAVLAVEDPRFYQHHGLCLGRPTIELQLAQRLYPGGALAQAAVAVKLDVAFPKSHVLLMYLNSVHFGHGYRGAVAAAGGYFQARPDELSWPQAALLAGVLKAPDGLDPYRHPAAARARREYVLSLLADAGALTAGQARAAARTDVQLARHVLVHS